MDRRVAILLLGGLALFSGFVVYPVVHEGGHYLVGKALEVEVRHVVWTPLGGKRPHVSFGNTPGGLIPWINAAGLLLPTLVGGLIMIIWLRFCARWSQMIRAVILIPAVLLLMGNLGLLGEVFAPPNYQLHHMYPLAHYLGLRGLPSVLFQLVPAIIAVGLFVLCLRKVRVLKRGAERAGQAARAV